MHSEWLWEGGMGMGWEMGKLQNLDLRMEWRWGQWGCSKKKEGIQTKASRSKIKSGASILFIALEGKKAMSTYITTSTSWGLRKETIAMIASTPPPSHGFFGEGKFVNGLTLRYLDYEVDSVKFKFWRSQSVDPVHNTDGMNKIRDATPIDMLGIVASGID